jgi:hypothetical protein
MKRTLELLCIGLVAGGLLTGCPKKPTEEPQATATQTTAKPETIAKPATAAQTAAQAEPVNEENYNKALFEKSCVTAKIEDTEKQKAIIDEIYARYGFDEESFGKAQEAMKDKPEVTAALTTKMVDCTAEMAASFAKADAAGTTAGTTGTTGKEEVKVDKPKTPSKAWKAGGYTDGAVKGANLEGAQLRVKINDDGKLSGSFQGKREGKAFSIPFNGEIAKDGQFNATGNRGPNNARVSGRFKSGQLNGAIQGTINKQGFRVTYVAK